MNKSVITTKQFETLGEFKQYLQHEVMLLPEPHNRPVKASGVRKMQNSIETVGIYRSLILVYTNRFSADGSYQLYVIDGQHLRQAILDTNFDEIEGFKDVKIIHIDDIDRIDYLTSILNDVGNKWNLDNFLKLWIARDKQSYLTLSQDYLMKKNYTTLNSIVEGSLANISNGNRDFKRGDFKIDVLRLNKIEELFDFAVNIGFPKSKSSFAGFVRYYNERGGNVTVDKLTKGMPKLIKQTILKGNTGRDTFKSLLIGFC